MSQRAHFWLRIAGLSVIVLASVLPRLYGRDSAPHAQHGSPVELAAVMPVAISR